MKWDDNIHLSAKDGNLAAVQEWLDAGLFVDKRDNFERTLLHHAAWSGRVAVMHKLIEVHADVNARDKDQFTPLHYAAQINQKDGIFQLVQFNADVDARNIRKETPVFIAASLGNVNTLGALLESGADVSLNDIDGRIPGNKFKFKVPETDRQKVRSMLMEAVVIQQKRTICCNTSEETQAKAIHPSTSSGSCAECCTIT